MKPIGVKSSTYIDPGVENNVKHPKFEVGNPVRIAKHKRISAKFQTSKSGKAVFTIKKVKSTAKQTYLIEDFTRKENCWNASWKRTLKNKSNIV